MGSAKILSIPSFCHCFLALCLISLLAGCSLSDADATVPMILPESVAPVWRPLYLRLRADGLEQADLPNIFAALGETLSEDPMGRKIRELYKKEFLPKPPTPPVTTPKKTVPPLYQGVVTQANAQKCSNFLKTNKAIFDAAEQRYGVPREIAVALLFVETRLGEAPGKGNAFRNLASMAASRDPSQIPTYLEELPNSAEHLDWIRDTMERRSDWAYKELTALLINARSTGNDPLAIPGSIYGAVGLCQFMPSNIPVFGADGDGDGTVDLFKLPDAVASLSYYLVKNGWKSGLTRAQQHKVIKTYNRVNIYANTILTLAEATKNPSTADQIVKNFHGVSQKKASAKSKVKSKKK